MALNIPLPGSFGDSFSKGLATGSDVMQRMVMNPYDMQLRQAQAEKERAEATKATMLSQLMNSFLGGDNSGGTGTGTGGTGGGTGGKSAADRRAMLGWMLGLGEMPSDKRAAELANQKDIKTFDINSKKQADIIDSAYTLKNNWKALRDIEKTFKARPDATGLVQGTLADLHLSQDKDLGKLIPAFAAVQANLAKNSTARPGIGAINWAGLAKMNAKDSHEINMGKLDTAMQNARQEYDTYRQQYKQATGQEMPTFEKFMEEEEQQAASGQGGGQPAGAPAQPAQMSPAAQQQMNQESASLPQQGGAPQPPPGAQQSMPPGMTPDIQKALSMMPPKLSKMAMDAISQGADPHAVIQEAIKLLNPQQGAPR